METLTSLHFVRRFVIAAVLAGLALFLAAPGPTSAAVIPYTVNDPGDLPDVDTQQPHDGICRTVNNTCTLRAAIQQSFKTGGPNSFAIGFSIGTPGNIPTISPTTALPAILFPGTIDGSTSQAGRVEISGASAPANTSGLTLVGAGMTIKNLVINRFPTNGILIAGASNTVTNTWVGTNKAGNSHFTANNDVGIFIGGGGVNTIGPDNVLTGNKTVGLEIAGSDSNVVKDNRIGRYVSGGNTFTQPKGILIRADADNNIVGGTAFTDRNTFGGNFLNGIEIRDDTTTGNQVLGNFFGDLLSNGTSPGNGTTIWIHAGAAFNTIGGTAADSRNLIGKGGNEGILIEDATTHDNTVQGNYIGTDSTGTQDLGNGGTGVAIAGGAHDNTIGGITQAARNVIVNNGDAGGVHIAGDDNTVQGNYIGVAPDGIFPMPNDEAGVTIEGNGNRIGGSEDGAGNVISGHSLANIRSSVGAGTVIDANFIGTNAAGTAALVSGAGAGIILETQTIVGGRNGGNVISGNTDGVVLSSLDALGSVISGNAIGVAADRVSPIPNTQNGVLINSSLPEATVALNIIAFNDGAGVNVAAAGALGVEIGGNQIYKNGGLGIDLGDDGVTPNDDDDADAGANGLLNAPVIVPIGDGDYEVALDSVPNATFYIDIFENDVCDPSGHGEGREYTESILDVETDADGHFSVTRVGDPALLTATAVNIDTRDTSEFSECVDTDVVPATPTPTPEVTETPPPVTATVTPTATAPAETSTPTATAPTSPTPTGTPGGLVQGDFNCDGDIDEEDALGAVLEEAGLTFEVEAECPGLGEDLGNVVFGDVNCSGAFDLEDALALFLFLAGLEFDINRPCADIGSGLVVDGTPAP